MNTFNVYGFANDTLHVIRAECELSALEQAPEPCYCVVDHPSAQPSWRYLAINAADDVFEIPGGHWGDDAASAVAALKQHRGAIQDWQTKHNREAVE